MKFRDLMRPLCLPGGPQKSLMGMAFILHGLLFNHLVAIAAPVVGVPCESLPIWQTTATYLVNQQVQMQGMAYQAKWWTRGQLPEKNSDKDGAWRVMGNCTISSNQSPTASFTRNTQWLTVWLDASASSDADGTIASWDWDFGDGTKASGAQTSHAYTKPGIYVVTLSVKDQQGAKTGKMQSINVSTVMRDPLTGKYAMRAADLQVREQAQTTAPVYTGLKASMATRSNAEADAVLAGRAANPENVKRLEKILPESLWNRFFPNRHPAYTYTGFLQSAAKFAGFCRSYADGRDADAICRKSLATMFAHFAQETGGHNSNASMPQWQQGLMAQSEAHCSDTTQDTFCTAFCVATPLWPCGKDAQGRSKNYYGRGAKQLTYNFNYGQFSLAMFDDHRVLLDAPERVAQSWLNLASALFFFVNSASPYPSMLNIIDGTWQPNAADRAAGITPGFGATINVINDIECGKGRDAPGSLNRIEYYRQFAAALKVPIPPEEQLSCARQQTFQSIPGGSATLPMYWKPDISYVAGMPEGKSFACKLDNDTSHFKALKAGDYQRCVQASFDLQVNP